MCNVSEPARTALNVVAGEFPPPAMNALQQIDAPPTSAPHSTDNTYLPKVLEAHRSQQPASRRAYGSRGSQFATRAPQVPRHATQQLVSRSAPRPTSMEPFLREWRQDALNKAQYESAIFIGDKLLALTGPPPGFLSSVRQLTDLPSQETITMPSGSRRFTSRRATTRAPRPSSPSTTSSRGTPRADTSPATAS